MARRRKKRNGMGLADWGGLILLILIGIAIGVTVQVSQGIVAYLKSDWHLGEDVATVLVVAGLFMAVIAVVLLGIVMLLAFVAIAVRQESPTLGTPPALGTQPARKVREPIPNRLRQEVLERDGYRCVYCGRSPTAHDVVLHIDHRIPVTRGGQTTKSNLCTVCDQCNLGKSDLVRRSDIVASLGREPSAEEEQSILRRQ